MKAINSASGVCPRGAFSTLPFPPRSALNVIVGPAQSLPLPALSVIGF